MKTWEITAAAIGPIITIVGAVFAAVSLYNYGKSRKSCRDSGDFVW